MNQFKYFQQYRTLATKLSYIHKIGNEPLQYLSVAKLLEKAADKFGDNIALVSRKQNEKLTFSQILQKADGLARGLQALGLKKQDRVGIWMPNLSEWYITFAACARLGIISVALNPTYTSQEIKYCINKVGLKALVCGHTFRDLNYYKSLTEICPELSRGSLKNSSVPSLKHIITTNPEGLKGTHNFHEISNVTDTRIVENTSPDDVCNIQFTSGTTGTPKAATLSHFGMVNNSYFCGKRMGLAEKPHSLCVQVPFFHVFGVTLSIVTSMHFGTKLVLPSEGFNASKSLDALVEEKCTIIYGTPTMYIDLIEKQKQRQEKISLDIVLVGGASCPKHVLEQMETVLNTPFASPGYGMTETSAAIFYFSPKDKKENIYTKTGLLQDHVEVKIVDGKGCTVPMGTPGELWVRGYNTMMGYWDDVEATKKALGDDGWLKTGDQFVLDEEGYGTIFGRFKEIIIRGGENVLPTEVEAVLISHEKIREVAVIGIPHDRLGEEVCACLRIEENCEITLEDVQKYCRKTLAPYKIPSKMKIVEQFPKTASGKIQKYLLQKMVTK